MPAIDNCFHIYNHGVEKRAIFAGEEDYQIFISYLRDYLTPPLGLESAKKTFTVKGREFRGVPHQPKNYEGKIELVAYSLMPDHFHLILRQVAPQALERFIRSLCTRYSMYFNKKYQHRGALFEGPYKSLEVKDGQQMRLLTRYFHRSHGYSSYPEYLDQRQTAWVKPEKGLGNYRNYIEKYALSRTEAELLARISFENEAELQLEPELNQGPRRPVFELAAAAVLLLILVSIGLRNIYTPNPTVLGISIGGNK